jgi:hypothetical protein
MQCIDMLLASNTSFTLTELSPIRDLQIGFC